MHSKAVTATGGNHFEYSELHVLQWNDQNLALANMTNWDQKCKSEEREREREREIMIDASL